MGRWDKYDACPMCKAPTGVRCWVMVRGANAADGSYTFRPTEEPGTRRHPRRPLLPAPAVKA